MARNDALQGFALRLGACFELAFQRVRLRLQRQRCIGGPVSAAGVLREHHRARRGRELDFEIVAPMLAELLQVAAAVGGGHARRGLEHHHRSFIHSRCGDVQAPPQHIQSCHSHRLPHRGWIAPLDFRTKYYILRYVNRHNRNQQQRMKYAIFL
jgi:hypothetical protein